MKPGLAESFARIERLAQFVKHNCAALQLRHQILRFSLDDEVGRQAALLKNLGGSEAEDGRSAIPYPAGK
jgi:hypothetical protein